MVSLYQSERKGKDQLAFVFTGISDGHYISVRMGGVYRYVARPYPTGDGGGPVRILDR